MTERACVMSSASALRSSCSLVLSVVMFCLHVLRSACNACNCTRAFLTRVLIVSVRVCFSGSSTQTFHANVGAIGRWPCVFFYRVGFLRIWIYFSMAARAVLDHCYGAVSLHTLCVQRFGETEGTARCAAIRVLHHDFYLRVWVKFRKLWKEEVESVLAVVKAMDADVGHGGAKHSESSASSSHVNMRTSTPNTPAAERDWFDAHRAIEVTFVMLSGRWLGQHWFHYSATLYDVEEWANKQIFTELGPREIWILCKQGKPWNTELWKLLQADEESLTLTLVKRWWREPDPDQSS